MKESTQGPPRTPFVEKITAAAGKIEWTHHPKGTDAPDVVDESVGCRGQM